MAKRLQEGVADSLARLKAAAERTWAARKTSA